jgi:predicted GNAT family N-acyltransferase
MPVVAATGVAFSRDWRSRQHGRGAQKIVLNARDNVTEFYAKHGYAVVGEAETLFGAIRHVRMARILS